MPDPTRTVTEEVRLGYLTDCMRVIQERGHMIQAVFPALERQAPCDECRPMAEMHESGRCRCHCHPTPVIPFAYTVGLSRLGLPEIVVRGLPADVAGRLLNNAADMSRGRRLATGRLYEGVAKGLPVMFCDTDDLGTAIALYGEADVTAIQMLWPDAHGRMPDEPGCDASIRRVQGRL